MEGVNDKISRKKAKRQANRKKKKVLFQQKIMRLHAKRVITEEITEVDRGQVEAIKVGIIA